MKEYPNEIKVLIAAAQRVIAGKFSGDIQDLMDNLEGMEDALYKVQKEMMKGE
jgi:hypothetical protein